MYCIIIIICTLQFAMDCFPHSCTDSISHADLSLVECYETVECSNSTSTLMTAADCCLGSISGLAYIKPGSEKCYACIGNFLPTEALLQ